MDDNRPPPLRLRLTELTARLDELMAENYLLRERALNAAAEARTWPDVRRATQRLVDAQPPYSRT